MTMLITWEIVRASGFVAYTLVSLSVILGLMMSLRWQSARWWPRQFHYEFHQFLILLAGFFTVVHGVFAWLDPFMKFRWYELVIPGASHYRPLWMALGIIAAELGLLVVLSTWLRPHIGYPWWRRLHGLTFLVFLLATVHGLGTGSDTKTPWALLFYGVPVAAVSLLGLFRLYRIPGLLRWGTAGVVGFWIVGIWWVVKGPLQSNWSQVANNHQGTGARIALASVPAVTSTPRGISPTSVQGSVTERQVGLGTVQLNLWATLPSGNMVAVTVTGNVVEDGSLAVTGGTALWEPPHSPAAFEGPITVTAQGVSATLHPLSGGKSYTFQLTLTQLNPAAGTFAGQVQITAE